MATIKTQLEGFADFRSNSFQKIKTNKLIKPKRISSSSRIPP